MNINPLKKKICINCAFCWINKRQEPGDYKTEITKRLNQKCSLYSRYKTSQSQNLEFLSNNQKEKIGRNRFWISSGLIILGILATIILGAASWLYIKK